MKRMLDTKIALVTGGNSGGSSSIDLATLRWEQGGKDGYETRDNPR